MSTFKQRVVKEINRQRAVLDRLEAAVKAGKPEKEAEKPVKKPPKEEPEDFEDKEEDVEEVDTEQEEESDGGDSWP
jgi:hypothetical protein